MEKIFLPTVKAMQAEGRPFQGVLYFGLMLTQDGPKVVEYNARFGDPETQPILSMLDTDLMDIFQACVNGTLDQVDIRWKEGAACCIVLASGGYPFSIRAVIPSPRPGGGRKAGHCVPRGHQAGRRRPDPHRGRPGAGRHRRGGTAWRRPLKGLRRLQAPSPSRICTSAPTSARYEPLRPGGRGL